MSEIYAFVERDYDEHKACMDYLNSVQSTIDFMNYPENYHDEPHPGSYYPPGHTQQKAQKEYVKKLINDHWNYIEQVLIKSDLTGCRHPNSLKEIEFHYKTAFEHGWKHAMEYQKDVNY